jgi:hypothetical protein
MFRILPALRHAQILLALLSGSSLFGAAIAADDPPNNQPDATAAIAAHPAEPPIPLNSGVSPHEFEADHRKVTVEYRPDGVRVYHMNGQGMKAVTATIGPDGKIQYHCTDHPETSTAPVTENVHEQ